MGNPFLFLVVPYHFLNLERTKGVSHTQLGYLFLLLNDLYLYLVLFVTAW